MKVACEQLPLLKILLHAAKHPTCTVNGVLLGSEQQQKDGSSGEGEFRVTDIVPLFHASYHLAAPTEVALAQVIQAPLKHTGIISWQQHAKFERKRACSLLTLPLGGPSNIT
jgi:hypothetical protein